MSGEIENLNGGSYKVVSYDKEGNYHLCLDDNGYRHRIDLTVNGDFPDMEDPQSLVGKTVTFSYAHPYISIAVGVRVFE